MDESEHDARLAGKCVLGRSKAELVGDELCSSRDTTLLKKGSERLKGVGKRRPKAIDIAPEGG